MALKLCLVLVCFMSSTFSKQTYLNDKNFEDLTKSSDQD